MWLMSLNVPTDLLWKSFFLLHFLHIAIQAKMHLHAVFHGLPIIIVLYFISKNLKGAQMHRFFCRGVHFAPHHYTL